MAKRTLSIFSSTRSELPGNGTTASVGVTFSAAPGDNATPAPAPGDVMPFDAPAPDSATGAWKARGLISSSSAAAEVASAEPGTGVTAIDNSPALTALTALTAPTPAGAPATLTALTVVP